MGSHGRLGTVSVRESERIVVPPQNVFKATDYVAALEQAGARYHKVVLVVGRPGSGKTALLTAVSREMQIPLLNLGLELSKKLLSLTARERKLKASDIIADLLDGQESSRVAVDNTEIVFDPSLMLNPLGLIQTISRTRLLIWSWNGDAEDGHIIYAHSGHPEYCRLPSTDVTLVAL